MDNAEGGKTEGGGTKKPKGLKKKRTRKDPNQAKATTAKNKARRMAKQDRIQAKAAKKRAARS